MLCLYPFMKREGEIERQSTPCCDVSVALISLLNWNGLLLLIMFSVRMMGPLPTIPPSSFRHTNHFQEDRKTVEKQRERASLQANEKGMTQKRKQRGNEMY